MTLISIVCLLALSSAAFGRSAYDSYQSASSGPAPIGMRDLLLQQKSTWPAVATEIKQAPIQTTFVQNPAVDYSSGLTSVVSQTVQPQPAFLTNYAQPKPTTFIQNERIAFPQAYSSSSQINLPSPVAVNPQQQLLDQQQLLQQKIQESLIVTEADMLCRGHQAETVIPKDNNRRFVLCVDDGKGFEQECPKGLLYHTESRRCERKLGPLDDPCATQPCLNGGQCIRTDFSSYKCQCAPGFDGQTCELDARVCQTQYPCGKSLDARCQSFRFGAALQHVCILQNGLAFGLNLQQVMPNPCNGVNGPRSLGISDKGFIMCDGESMYIESCPGGTVWDDSNKACVWPDMQGFFTISLSDQTRKHHKHAHKQPKPNKTPAQSDMFPSQFDQQINAPSYAQTTVTSYNTQFPQQYQSVQKPVESIEIQQPVTTVEIQKPVEIFEIQRPSLTHFTIQQEPQAIRKTEIWQQPSQRDLTLGQRQTTGY